MVKKSNIAEAFKRDDVHNFQKYGLDGSETFDFPTTDDNLVTQTGSVPITVLTNASILHLAAWYSAHKIMKTILKNSVELLIDAKTAEGFTPLHVACGVGDFVAVEILCKAGANTRLTDKNGRTALHHAVGPNPAVAVVLCGFDKDLPTIEDYEHRTPIYYCLDQSRATCHEFLSNILKSSENIESGSSIDSDETVDSKFKSSRLWIPFNIKIPFCLNIASSPNNPQYCTCNTFMENHELISANQQFINSLKRDKKECYEIPTNTFGEIETFNKSYASDYVRISEKTSPRRAISLINEVWKVEKPQLVLSFYGDYTESSVVKEKIRRLLWKTIDSSVTWIITDGLKGNISPVVTEAVKEFIQAYGVGQVQAVGIVPWKFVSQNSALISPSYTGMYPAHYQVTDPESETHQLMDLNLTHYLLVDTARNLTPHYEFTFRTSFESALKIWSNDGQESASLVAHTPIQLCSFLTGGDESTLRAIYSASQNSVPVVLLRDTGGLADILIQCLEDTELGNKAKYKRAISEGSRQEDAFKLSPANIKQTILHYWTTVSHPELAILMVQELLEKPYLFSVCENEEDEANELDYHLLSLLMNPVHTQGYEPGRLNESLLAIAISLNRSDIAKEKVFVEGVKWNDEVLAKHMTGLLSHNKVTFIKVFIEKGFQLTNYLTPEILQLLYTLSVHSERHSDALVNVIRGFIKIPDKMNLSLIGRTLRILVGGQYNPVYLDPKFFILCQAAPQSTIFENPATDLFIWSLLTEHFEMAEYFWSQVQDPLPAALFAALVLRRLAVYASSLVTKDEMLETSQTFETGAYNLLTECFNDNPEMAFDTLVRERKLFGGMSCLILASEGKSMTFISHQCSEHYLQKVWNGIIDSRTKMFPFIVALGIGIIVPPLVPFTVKFILKRTQSYATEFPKFRRQNTMEPTDLEQIQNERKPLELPGHKKPKNNACKDYFRKIKGFYLAPCVRFSYTTLSYITFLCFFTYVLLFALDLMLPILSVQYLLLYIWVFSFVMEHIRQGFMCGVPFKVYIAKLWKSLEVTAISLFIFGTALQLMVLAEEAERISNNPINPVGAIQEPLMQLSRIFFGLALCVFYHRILELFTVNMRLGPMVIMVQSMVVRDLIPFLALFIVSITGFAILQWVVAYKSTASLNPITNLATLFNALQLAYFQVFGEYNLEKLTGETLLDSCKEGRISCPGGWSIWLSPILLGVYVILTQVLLLNLVIAMFASTYMRIESASTKYWALQRYYVMREYVDRSPLPPPFILLWHLYIIIRYLFRLCRKKGRKLDHPFKKSYEENSSREHRLIHWEKLRFWDYHRFVILGKKRKKDKGKSVSVRTTVVAAKASEDGSNILNTLQEQHQITQNNITQISSKTERLKQVEEKVDRILLRLKEIMDSQSDFGTKLIRSNTSHLLKENALTQQLETGSPAKTMDASFTERITRILNEENEPAEIDRNILIRALSSDETVQQTISTPLEAEIIKPHQPKQLLVFEKGSHRIAIFVPPTADRTPCLFPQPLKWDAPSPKQSFLSWNPSFYSIQGWSDSDDFREVERRRKTKLYLDPKIYPPPDPETGYPRNPCGRTGICGRGHLPKWGPNSAMIIIITSNSMHQPSDVEIIVYKHQLGTQLPWLLVQHPDDCDQEKCVKDVFNLLIFSRSNQLSKMNPNKHSLYQNLAEILNRTPLNIVHKGIIDDMINTDNAWIEPIAVHLHVDALNIDRHALLQIVSVEGVELTWIRKTELNSMRKSHEKLVQKVIKSSTLQRDQTTIPSGSATATSQLPFTSSLSIKKLRPRR